MQSWGPGILSFEAVNVNFGYFVQHIGPMKKHYWFFLIPPSGPASGSWRCWKMLSWGPGIQSFEAVIMNLEYLGQHTSSMKKHYGYFLIAPSGQASGPRRCWKLQSWGPGIQNFEAVNMNLGYFVQHTGWMKNIIGTFWYQPQGKLQAHGDVGKDIWRYFYV